MNANTKILIVDDIPDFSKSLANFLVKREFQVAESNSPRDGIEKFRNDKFDIVLLDFEFPDFDMDGIAIAKEMVSVDPFVPIVILTAYDNIPRAVEAIKAGVFDFLIKNLSRDNILLTIEKALRERKLMLDLERLKDESLKRFRMIGKSDVMMDVFARIEKIAPYSATVLITGETGTGKELVAKAIHNHSKRSTRPFETINCAGIPKDLVESTLFGHERGAFTGAIAKTGGRVQTAEGGTLFLDEIGDMAIDVQAKLLRFIETGEYSPVGSAKKYNADVRIISATNKNLEEDIRNGKFRQDLYSRLNTFNIDLPPLSKRKEDIPLIADYFLEEAAKSNGMKKPRLTDAAINILKFNEWKGNIRDLKNCINRAFCFCEDDVIDTATIKFALNKDSSVPFEMPEKLLSLKDFRNCAEKAYIEQILKESEGNIIKAAKILGLDRSYLYRKINELGIYNHRHDNLEDVVEI